ncbi:ankyrin repeat domain-containing protein [Mucilaginibacter gotjawali]|uniref:Ankyrin repeat protein n=2 Tax=Mucilaginibacter gotjawali TaxID=1550579 RepID=A0A0X8X2S5_9SPHI|nr:ankyrin repeat domain-containing protein [Mucilaginibacter gotjawali]MBB3057768.1 hypothetical protein [Mucilaginibacter gotjawali]BAU52569.1 Ankyrin repeat protein [Mucilaginibacter gotjawali]
MNICKVFFICLVLNIGLTKCTGGDAVADGQNLLASDYRIFHGTIAWDLAKAIDGNDREKIIKIVGKNKHLINVVDPKYGQTLLGLAVYNDKYNSCQALVDLGANPNAPNNYDGKTPLMEAVNIGYADGETDSRLLILLLKHGGNPNNQQKYIDYSGSHGQTPLMIACAQGNLSYVKILINAGADINKNYSTHSSLLYSAMLSDNPDLVMFLIQKGIDFTKPLFITDSGSKEYITESLRTWRFDLGSEKYKKKMLIVAFLKEHGMDYRKTKIPDYYYDSYDAEYLNKY